MTSALASLALLALGFAMGWSASQRGISKRQSQVDDLVALLRSPVDVSFETIARDVGAV